MTQVLRYYHSLSADIQDLVLSFGNSVSASASTGVLSADGPSDPPLDDSVSGFVLALKTVSSIHEANGPSICKRFQSSARRVYHCLPSIYSVAAYLIITPGPYHSTETCTNRLICTIFCHK